MVEVTAVEPVAVEVMTLSARAAVLDMRRPFTRAFGRSPVGRSVGAAAWSAFHAALLHGHGIAAATSHALVAAQERNARSFLVARWSEARIDRAVMSAAEAAANAS